MCPYAAIEFHEVGVTRDFGEVGQLNQRENPLDSPCGLPGFEPAPVGARESLSNRRNQLQPVEQFTILLRMPESSATVRKWVSLGFF